MTMHNPLVGGSIPVFQASSQPVASPDGVPMNPKGRMQLTPSTNLGLMVFACVGVLAMLHMGGFRTTVAVTKG